jgi:sphingomyelin phosphodiesterase
MKINAIILSLVAASTVIAAPAPVQLEKRSVLDKLGPLITDAVKTLGCGACVTALAAVKTTSMINRNWVLDAGRSLCPTLGKQNPEVVS